MSAAASPHDISTRARATGLRLAPGLLVVALCGAIGCSKAPSPVGGSGDERTQGAKADPWATAATRLKKATDYPACKAALNSLSADTSAQEGSRLPAISAEALSALTALVPLSAQDREELGGSAFSPHDPAYLADCLYLRDAARSLDVGGMPPERQADIAFAWVCRQVYLYPWLRHLFEATYEPTALPPVAVLRRGYGSGLERMYVFLALLQQLELDACLIGGADAGKVEARHGPPILYPTADTRAPRGPFWAVGVRTGADVRLYDPWRGAALPVTLNQLRANPDAAKAWFEDKAHVSGATLDDARKATAYLAVPVNSLSPRMAIVEAKLKPELGVNLAFDAKALRSRFPDPKPAYWNTPNGPFDYGRAARTFYPVDQGGTEAGRSGNRLYDHYMRQQIPASAFRLPDALQREEARSRLGATAAIGLALAFLEPPNPRERIQRGRFQEAARDAVAKQEAFAAGLERLRVNKDADQQIQEWIETANALYADLGRARLNMDAQAEAAAQQLVENHWKAPGAQFLVDRASAEVGQAEASLVLALCKHEIAEGLQVRLERAAPQDAARLKSDVTKAWETALSAWRTYEQSAGAHAGFPGRAAHAKALAARARVLAAAK